MFLRSPLQLASHYTWQLVFPGFSGGSVRQGKKLSAAVVLLCAPFFSPFSNTRHALLPDFPICLPSTLPLTSCLLTLSGWAHSSAVAASTSFHMIKFLSGSCPQDVDVTVLILAGVNMSCLELLLCDSGVSAVWWLHHAWKITFLWVSRCIVMIFIWLRPFPSCVPGAFCDVNIAGGNWPKNIIHRATQPIRNLVSNTSPGI